MKHVKAKLLTSVIMVLIAAILMGTSTYAWFTISTNPEVKDLTATVVVNENLEIAYRFSAAAPNASAAGDTLKADTYGNLVSADTNKQSKSVTGTVAVGNGNYSVDYAVLNKTLRPATLSASDTTLIKTPGGTAEAVSAGEFYYPLYDEDGRIAYFEQLTELAIPGVASGSTTGMGYLVARAGSGVVKAKADGSVTNGKIYGYYIDFWVRSNVEGEFQISAAAGRSTAATADTDAGSYFAVDADKTGNTTLDTAKKVLAENIGVAISFNGGTITALTHTLDSDDETKAIFTESQKIGTFVDTHTADDADTAGINTDIPVRIYVYLEGADVTNAAASIDGGILGGTLNLQFKNTGITVGSMDSQS